MNRTTSSCRKRWFFARAMHRAYREFLEKGARKRRQAEKRELFAEALEPRVLFSGAPVAIEEVQGEEPRAEHAVAAQEASLLESGGEKKRFSIEEGLEADFTEEDLERLAAEALSRWEKTGLTEEQREALERLSYEVDDLEGSVIGAAEGDAIFLDIDAAGLEWFIDDTEWLDEEYVEIDGLLRAWEGEAGEGVDLLSVIMHEQGHILGLLDQRAYGDGGIMDGLFDEGERRTIVDGLADGAIPGSLSGIHYAISSAGISGNTLSIVGDADSDSVELRINGGNYEYSLNGGAFIDLGSISGVDNITIEMGDGTDSVTLSSAISIAGTLTISAETITVNQALTVGTAANLTGETVVFESTVDGAMALDVNASTLVRFRGDVGGNTPLASIDTTGSAATEFGTGFPVVTGATSDLFNVDAGLDTDGNNRWEDTVTGNPTGLNFLLDSDTAGGSAVTRVTGTSSLPGIAGAYDLPGGFTGNVGGALLNFSSDPDTNTDEESFLNAPGNWTDENVSFEIWFKPDELAPDNASNTNGQILFEDGGGNGLGLLLDDNGDLRARKVGNNVEVRYSLSSDPNTLLTANEFIQAVVTYNYTSGQLQLFVNGNKVGDQANAAAGNWTGGDGFGLGTLGDANVGGLGGGQQSTESFDGQIAIFRAYRDQVLTGAEVLNNYNAIVQAVPTTVNVATTGAQAYGDDVFLGLSTNLSAGSSDVTFAGSVDALPALGGLTLDIDTTGATLFTGVGGISIIPNLTLSNASSGALSLPGSGTVTLGGVIDTSAGNGSFTFNDDVESASADATLVLNTGSGTVDFNGDFGATTNFGGITQLGTGTVTFGGGTTLATPITNSVFVFSGPGGGTAAEFIVLGTIGSGQTGNNNGLQAINDATVTFGDGANAATVNIADAAGAAANLDTRNGGRFDFINLSGPVVFSDAPDNANGGDGTIIVGTGTNNPTIDFVGGNFEVAIGTGGIGYFEFLSGIINQNSNNLITGQGVGTQAGSLADRVTIGGGPGATVEAWLNLNAGAPGDWNTNSGLGFVEILENGRVTARSLNMGSADTGGLDLLIDGGTIELTGDIDFRNLGVANDKITFLDGVINGNADGSTRGTIFLRDSATSAFDFQGGTLRGFAAFNGTLTQDGGTLTVGNDAADFANGDAPATMTITQDYDLNAGVLELTLGDVASLSADTLTVNGNVDLTGTGILSLVQGSTYATAGAVEGATTLTLLSYAGTLTGEFAGLANGGELVVGTDVYTIDYGTGAASSITLTLQRINDVTAPVVSGAFTPADDAADVDVATDLIITFDEPVYAVEGAEIRLDRDDPTNTVEETFTYTAGSWSGDNGGTVTVDGAVVTINPGANLGSTGEYHVEITGTSFENVSGLAFAGFTDATTWSFTAVDTAVPTTTVEVVGGVLTITDSDPFDTLDNITISQSGNIITITTTDQPLVIGSGVTAGGDNRTATVDATTLTGLSIDTGGGADVVTLQGLNIAGDLSFASVETINLEGVITTTGSQTYGKGQAVEVSGNTTLSGTTITFDGNVNSAGAHDLVVNASTALEINANVGATNALGTFDTTGSALVKVGQSSAGVTLDTLQGDIVWNFDFSTAGTGATVVEDLAGAKTAAGDSFSLIADPTNSPTIAPPTGTSLPVGITAAGQFTGGTVAAGGDGGFRILGASADSSPLSVVPAVNEGDASFEFWFAPDDLGTANPNNQMIWETGGGTGTGIAIMGTDSGSAGTLRFRNTTDGTEVDYDLAGNHVAGEWIHVVATLDLSPAGADVLTLFINGAQVGTNSTTSDITNWDGGDPSALGASGGSNAGGWGSGVANPLGGAGSFESFNGQIGIFRMYRENLDVTQIANNLAFQNSTSTGPTSVTIGAAAHLHGNTTVGTNLNLNSSGTVTLGALNDDGVSSTPGNVTITSSGITTLSGPVGNTSPVQSLTVTANRIDVGTASLEASGDLTLNSPVRLLTTSDFITGGSTLISGTVDLGAFDLTVTGNGDISGVISGSGALTKAGAGSSLLVLSGNNTLTGGVTLAGGIVQADVSGAFGVVGISTLTFDGGTRLLVGNGVDVAHDIVVGSNSGVGANGLIEAVSGTGTVSGTITINNSASAGGHFAGGGGTLRITGDVISSVDVTQRAGTVEYLLGPGSSLSFLGITGTARLLGADALTAGAEVRLGASGDAVLDLNGFNHSIAGLSSASNGNSKRVDNGSATDATLTVTAGSTFDGSIRDNIDLVVDASGETFTLDGSHTYSGTTTVTAGSLLLDGTLIGNPTVVAGYRADFDPDTQPANWQYLWNDGVLIGDAANYTPMLDAGTVWTGTGDTVTSDTDDGALRLTANGGTPGLAGTPTNDQFAIAAYTVTADGLYVITDSFLTRNSTSGNGVSLRLFLNDSTTPFYSANVTSNNTRIFDQSLGYLSAGDTIYFAVGPNGNNANDNFTWDFSIATGSATPGGITVESGAALGGNGATNSAVTVDAGAILDPGTTSAGGGTLRTGNLTLSGALNIDIPSGGSADQVIVNGTVDISGATLTGTAGSELNFTAPLTIISNDDTDGVTGAFASSQITLGGTTFDIATNGGDGNDVILTAPNRAPVAANLDQTQVYATGAGVVVDLDPITVTDPDTASVVVVSEVPFINYPDLQSGTAFNTGFTSPDTARGFSFEIKFTPEEADVTAGGSGSENRRILFEIGGSSNGTGIYLIEGIPHFISKMNTPGNTTSPTTVGVADLDWEGGTGDGMVVIPLTTAPLVAGQPTTLAGIFSLDELEYSANGAAPTSVALLNRNGTENWEGDNSVFIGVDTGPGGPGGLSTSGLFNAGSFAALSGTDPVEYARMWNVSDIFAPNPSIGTASETITATLTIDSYVDAGTTGSLASAGGGSFDSGTGIFTVTGDAATVNAALAAVQFTTGTATPANQAIAVSIADGGEDGVVPATGTIDLIEAALTVTREDAGISENGGTSTFTVSRNTLDNSAALTVTLTSDDTSEATVPATIDIPAGQASVTFTVSAQNDALADGDQTVTISAAATGFVDGSDTISITDDETPTLTVTAGDASISENGGASTFTVSRNTEDNSAALTVTLTSDDTSEGTVPATVEIPAGQASVTFTLTAVDDILADGDQTVTVSAAAASFTGGSDTISITDDETPTLTVTAGDASISENGGTSTFTVSRNTEDNSAALNVTLSSDDTGEGTVPATVEIPAGQASVTFTLTAVDDAIVDGDQTVTVSAAATGFTGGSDDILITDDDVAGPVAIDVTNSATEAGGVNNLLTVVGGDGTTASGTSGTVFASHDGSVNVTHVTFNGTPFQTTNPGGTVVSGSSSANGTRVDGAYGTLIIGADGTYTYTLDATATDSLSSGDGVSDVFTYTIASGGEVGPGADIITGGFSQDGAGDRLNVDRSSSANLGAGTYNVNDFRVYVADHTLPGTITPMLLSGTPGGPYTTLWVGSAFDPTSNGEQIVAANGSFTLDATTEVYSGFFTAGGSAAIIGFVGSGSTDHDGSFTAPTAAGQTVTGISNPGLARTYAFGIDYTVVAGDLVGPGSDITEAVNRDTPGQDRLNVDRSRVLNLAAGTYDVDDFRLNVFDHTQGGTITPMLLSGTPGGPYTTLWVGSAFDPTTNGEQFVPVGGSFTLAAATDVYSGFFTTGGGAAIIALDADNSGSGSSQTDHDNSFTGPTAAGQTVTGFSNANLGRTYAFEITVSDSASANKGSVTIAVNGANDAPVANNDTNEATESAGLNTIEEFVGGDGVTPGGTSGNVLGGTGSTAGDVADSDVDGDDDPPAGDGSVFVAGVTYTGGGTPLGTNAGGVVVTGGTVVDGQYGTLTINPDGTYTYALDNAATNSLAAGDSVTDEFTYTISDTVIYADDFSGSGSLDGSTPDAAPGAETWTAGALWNADGTKPADGTSSAWLPFTPEAGKVYTLSADVNPELSGSTAWLAIGFGGQAPGDMDTGQFQAGGNNTSAWMLFREDDTSPSVIQTFGGPVANHDLNPDIVGSARLEVILDTTGANWTAEWKVDGTTLRNYTFPANPAIQSVGFGGLGVATGSIDNFSLVEVESDPATLTITINGTNDTAVITSAAQTGSITETADNAGGTDADPTPASGTITFDAAGLTATHTAEVLPGAAVTGGTAILTPLQEEALLDNLTLGTVQEDTPADGAGEVTWTYTVPNSEIDFLSAGETVEITHTVAISDGDLVFNGDFSANAADFGTFPGYISNPANPDGITGWTHTGAVGINPISSGGSPFANNGDNSTPVAFIQRTGSISQTVTGLTVGQTYALTFDYNERAVGGSTTVTATIAGETFTDPNNTPVGVGNPYRQAVLFFTATASSETLTISGTENAGTDQTTLIDNVRVRATQDVVVTITGANDAPVFAGDTDGGANTVAENAAIDTLVGITASFTDVDADDAATLIYTLTDDAGGAFKIDSATGVVSVADGTKIDFETVGNSLTITVQADDGDVQVTQNFTIAVTDVASDFTIAATDAVKAEGDSGNTAFTFTVTRTGDTTGVGSVEYTVSSSSADGADFGGSFPTDVVVNFADGETTKIVTVNVSGDTEVETDEVFTVTLNDASTGNTIGAISSADGTIQNDDVALLKQAPEGTDKTLTVDQDETLILTAADFGFSDPNDSPPDNFIGVVITTLPSAGTLSLDGVAVTAGQFVGIADIDAGKLTYDPVAGESGAAYADFTFQVVDDGAGSDTAGVVPITAITTAEDFVSTQGGSQTLTSFTDSSGTYTDLNFVTSLSAAAGGTILHGDGTVPPASSTAALTDNRLDTGALGPGINLVYQFGSPLDSNDRIFVFFNFNDPPSTIQAHDGTSLIGSPVSVGSASGLLGSLDLLRNGSNLLNDRAIYGFSIEVADLGVADPSTIAGVQFTGEGQEDFNLIGFVSVPGENTDQSPNTITIDVTPAKLAPEGADKTLTVDQDATLTITAADFGFSDSDVPPDNFIGVVITTLPTAGALNLDGVAVTAGDFVSIADINANRLTFEPVAGESGDSYADFTFQVVDDGLGTVPTDNVVAITNITTVEGYNISGNNSGSQTLTSFTDAGGTYTDLKFATFLSQPAPNGGSILHGNGTVSPGTGTAAMTDNRIDTGVLNPDSATVYQFSDTLKLTDKIFVFGNNIIDRPTEIKAYGSSGVLGTVTVGTIGSLGTFDFERNDGAVLSGRSFGGFSIDVADFGVADPSTILGIQFTGDGNQDFNMVGFASMPAGDNTDRTPNTITIDVIPQLEVSIAASLPNAAEPSTDGQFTVSLNRASGQDLVVSYVVTGDATPGSDYTGLSGEVTILAGDTSAVIDVSVFADSFVESAETVIVTLTGVTGAPTADTTSFQDGVSPTAAFDSDIGFLRESNPNAVFGGDANDNRLLLGSQNASNEFNVIVEFDLSSFTGLSDGAELTFPLQSTYTGPGFDLSIFEYDFDFAAATATWNNPSGLGTDATPGGTEGRFLSTFRVATNTSGALVIPSSSALNSAVNKALASGDSTLRLLLKGDGSTEFLRLQGNGSGVSAALRPSLTITASAAAIGTSSSATVSIADGPVTTDVIYVDSAWVDATAFNNDGDADDGVAGTQVVAFGINAFGTISEALLAVDPGGTIVVNGGTYNEDVSLTGMVTLRVTGPDFAEAVIIQSLESVAGTTIEIEGSSSLTIGSASDQEIAGQITGSGSLTKAGTGTLTISGGNDYTGATTVSAGEILVANDTALGSGAVGTTVANGATLILADGVTVADENVSISGAGDNFGGALKVEAGGTAEWGGDVLLSTNPRIGADDGGNLTISGVIRDNGSSNLVISAANGGSGTVTLSGANTYTGSTNITRGTLALGVDDALPTTTALVVDNSTANDDSILDLNGFDQTVASLTQSNLGGTGASRVINSAATSNTLTVSGNLNYSGTLQLGLDGANDSADLVAVGGDLNITNTTLDLSAVDSAPDDASYTLLTYGGTLTGTAFSSVVGLPAGYGLDFSTPGQINLVRAVTDVADWNLTGDASVTEGANASYTISLTGTLSENATATVEIAITDVDTTSGDYAAFTAAVQTAVDNYSGPGSLAFDGTNTLTYTGGTGGTSMSDLAITLGTTDDNVVEESEDFTVTLSNPGSTTGATVTIAGSGGASGSPFFTDQFDLAAAVGSSLPANSSWVDVDSDTEEHLIGNGLTFTGYETTGKSAELDRQDPSEIAVSNADSLEAGGTYYLAALMQHNVGTATWGQQPVAALNLTSGDQFGTGLTFGVIKPNGSATVNPFVGFARMDRNYTDTSYNVDATTSLASGATYFLLAKYEVTDAAANEGRVSLAVFADGDTIPTSEAGITWNVQQDTTYGWPISGTAALDSLYLYQGNTPGSSVVDEIRVGRAFEDVLLPAAAGGGGSAEVTTTINDNDTATFTIDDVTVDENAGTATFTVSLSNPVDIDVSIDVSYADVTATGGGVDYDSSADTVTFSANTTTAQTVTVAITNDTDVEALTETFTASLAVSASTPTGTRSVDTSDTGTGTITDNTPTTVYIDASFTNANNGNAVDGDQETGTTEGAIVGRNAFDTFAEAIAALDATQNGTIVVNGGIYPEAIDLTTFSQDINLVFVDGNSTVTSLIIGPDDTIVLGGNGTAVDLTLGDAGNQNLAGVISGPGSLTKQGTGTVTLTGANTYTGNTNLDGGTLVVDGSIVSADVILAANTTLSGSGSVNSQISGTSFTAAIIATGNLNLGDGSGTGFSTNASLDVGGNTVTISDSNSATMGDVTIDGGTLSAVNGLGFSGSANDDITGNGTIIGDVTTTGDIAAAGTGADRTGIINITGDLDAANSTLRVDVDGLNGGEFDQLVVSGDIDISGATLTTAGSVTSTGEIILISNGSANPVTGTFTGLAEGATVTINGVEFAITYVGGDGNDVVLVPANDPPTFTTTSGEVDSTPRNTEVEITFAEIAAVGDEADSDGTVIAFVVDSVASGTLRIGTDASSATAFVAGTNDTIDATRNAYWTPPVGTAGGNITAFLIQAQDDDGALSSGTVAVSVEVEVPEITVLDSDSDTILSGAAADDFGNALEGTANIVRVFTIRNTGNANLDLTGAPLVSITGSPDFQVTLQPATNPILPGGSATFEITFDPTTPGLQTAVVSILNSDFDEGVYTFDVQGFVDASALAPVPDAVEVYESGQGGPEVAPGNALSNDNDTGGAGLKVSSIEFEGTPFEGSTNSGGAIPDGGSVKIDGRYGTLEIASDGTFLYTLNSDLVEVRTLGVGETRTETFSYVSGDGSGRTPTQTITVTVNGASGASVGNIRIFGGSSVFEGFRFAAGSGFLSESNTDDVFDTQPLLTLIPTYTGTAMPGTILTVRILGSGGEYLPGGEAVIVADLSGTWSVSFDGLVLGPGNHYIQIEYRSPAWNASTPSGFETFFAPGINGTFTEFEEISVESILGRPLIPLNSGQSIGELEISDGGTGSGGDGGDDSKPEGSSGGEERGNEQDEESEDN